MKNKVLKIILAIALVLGVLVPTVAADGEQTIVEIAVGDDRFETLVAAVVAADLADTLSGGEWTVFAPTDDAFAKLGLNADNIASAFTTEELTDILLYHVINGEISSEKALTALGDVTMMNGADAGLKFFDGDIYVNDDAKVIIPDIDASNGIIHVVDTVILGPWPREAADSSSDMAAEESGPGTIVDIAVNDGRFNTLVAAVVAADLADTLSGGEWTVFAPTDDAFAKLGLNADNIASAFTKAELTDILLYHVINGEVFSDKALTLLGDVTMMNGQLAGLKFYDGNIYINDDSKVIIADINASNGVIHAVDTVILGPWPKDKK
ncbi:MAG: fasciclin domain-containing protein [Ardenticatenaceae bacterium]|nr:fasciclin domain-containing protein [Ardenticatenaceae bacterium]MCB8949648.1 fasciclin domain-containing protein [Ardenticatenaceae bacterium]